MHHPLTRAQLDQLVSDLATMHTQATEISQLLMAAYGKDDQRAMRAEDIPGAIQRLQWALERAEGESR